MDSIIRRAFSPFAAAWRVIVLTLIICATGQAWAIAKPVAVWNGEFKNYDKSHGGDYAIMQYTYDHTIADNTLTVNSTSSAGFISQASGKKNNKYMTLPFSAVVGFSDMPLPAEGGLNSLITVEAWNDSAQQNANRVGVGLTYDGKFKGIADGSAWDSGGTSSATYSARSDGYWSYVALAYKGASGGTDVYLDGNTTAVYSKSGLKSSSDTCYRAITIGGCFGKADYMSAGMKVHYVALVPSNDTSDIAYWSLLNMKATEVVTSGNTVTGGSNAGVTINTANGTATISGNTSAAAVFIQENTTLNFSSSATLTIGDGTGPLYVADGKALVIDASGMTTLTLANPQIKIVNGKIFGKELISVAVPSGNGDCVFEYEVADDGVYLRALPKTAVMGSNVHTDGTYVTTETQTAFTGITLQQFHDGNYEIRGRFSGANISGKAREGAGYNKYVTYDGEDNVTKIRYEMQVDDGGHIKCITIELTPNDGNTGIDVKSLGAYYYTGGTLGMQFLNDDGTKKNGTVANLGTAYNTSDSYSLYNLSITGKFAKNIALNGNTTLTVGNDIAATYSTLTVSGSGKLTISGNLNVESLVLSGGVSIDMTGNISARSINMGNGTAVSIIGGHCATFYWSSISGAGSLILDPGDGNTFTMSNGNTSYTGEAVIKSGTVKMGNATSFGSLNKSNGIRVKSGATLSSEGATSDAGAWASDTYYKNKAILEEGATLIPYVGNDTKMSAFSAVELDGDATIDATSCATALGLHYNWTYSHINLGEWTLTKVGANNLHLSVPNITGTGMLHVMEGSVSICDNYGKDKFGSLLNGKLKVDAGASFDYVNYNGGTPTFTVKDLELNGGVSRYNEASTLTVTGCLSGTGTTPMLILEEGVTLKPTSSVGGLTVTGSLTLNGTIIVDISEVDLRGKSINLPIITAPHEFNLETEIAEEGFICGSNTDWVLYTEEVSTGVYELGVKLDKTIESSLSWSGSSGTWSNTAFDAVDDCFYNDANQSVTFADNGESADPIAVTVSGAKTVNELNFTADNRNVTLSDDAITTTTVSKSGDGVATINSDLSVATSISVTDGVLVLNPTEAVVADAWTASDNGTLVVYVGAGETTTLPAITATTLIKRGAGELLIDATSDISGDIVVETGTLTSKASTTWSIGNSVTVKTGATLNINGEVRINKNPGNVVTSVMTLEPGATCSVRGNLYAYYSEYVSFAINGAITVDGNFYSLGDISVGTMGAITVGSSGSLAALWHIENNGTITLPALANLKKYDNEHAQTKITNSSTGKVVFNLAANMDVRSTDLTAYFAGSGKIVLNGNVWCGFSREGQWPSTIAVENNLKTTSGGFVFSRTSTIGTLSGDGLIRTDLDTGDSDPADRVITVVQTTNSVWSGTLYKVNGKMGTFAVSAAKGATEKTLTLSGTQQSGSDYTGDGKTLVINASTETTDAGSVNLTGTWVGNTTVAGEFGGTGALTGDLTMSDGSIFKVFASDTDGLSVSGTVSFPTTAGQSVAVDTSDVTLSTDVATTLITSSSLTSSTDISKLVAPNVALEIDNDNNKLLAYKAVASVTWGDDTVTGYTSLDAAVAAASNDTEHKYVTILENASFVPADGVKYKVADGVTATPISGSPEYGTPTVVTTDPVTGAVTYNRKAVNNPTTYTWVGGAINLWSLKANWQNSLSETADRLPSEDDDVVINIDTSSSPITIPAVTSVKAMSIGNTVEISASGADKTLTVTDGVVLTTETSTLTISGTLTLSGTVTTTVADKCAKWVYGESSKTYSVADPVAEIGGTQYGSLANAIDIATDAGLDSITVTDSTAEVPDGYYLINEGTGIARYQAAIVDGSAGVHYYATVDGAVTDFLGLYLASHTYDHFEIYSSTNVVINVNAASDVLNSNSLKIKCTEAGVSATLSPTTVEYEFVAGDPDENGIITYTRQEKATTYVWVSASGSQWMSPAKWRIGSSDGDLASRAPSTKDDVVLNDQAAVLVKANDINVASMTINGAVRITGNSGSLSSTTSINLASEGSILTISSVTLSPRPITSVTGKAVKSETYTNISGDTYTDYSVVAAGAMIGDIGYETLSDAITAASNADTITLAADCATANINLGGKSIKFSEGDFTFTGSFTGNGTVELASALKSADPARWAEGWTGTVVLPAGALGSPLNFNLYGNSESVVQITGAVSGYLPNDEIVTTVKIPSSASLTLTAFSPSYTNAFAKIVGEGTLSVPVEATTGASGNDLGNAANWGAGYNYSAYLLIKDVSQFTGSLAADQAAGIAIGAKPHKNTVGGKIIVDSGASATIASGKTWSAVNGIVVDGTLDVAGNVTDSIAGGSGNGAKTLNVNSGATITMGSGKTISGLSAVNLKGGSVNLGKLGAATTQKYVAFSGESTLTLECEYTSGSGVIFNGDTIESPFIKVESGATLNLTYGNFSGWNGNVCDGYIVNEGTLNISQKGSVSTFFRNHLVMTDGCTTHINGTAKLSLYGGPATEETAQIQLLSGTAELSADDNAGIGFGNVSNSGGYGGHGVGFNVGKDATLTVSAKIYQSNKDAGSNPIAKYGEGTLILSNSGNSPVETWTLYAGAIKSAVELTVNSGDNSKQVRKIVNDGSYIYILSPAEVTTTTFDFNSFTYGGLPVDLGEDDTIIVPSNCTGSQWHPSLSKAAGHPVIVRKEMNWKAGIGTMTIDSEITVYAYGSDGSVVNDGAVISGEGTLQLQNNVDVNGAASVLCTVAGSGKFSLANRNATLIVSSPLEGKVITSVTGAKVISESVDEEKTRYRVVYGTIFSVY